MSLKKYDKFLFGFIPGLLIPALVLVILVTWTFINSGTTYTLTIQHYAGLIAIIKFLFPSPLMGKMLMLSIMPNLAGVFLFYKQDTFKIAAGILGGAMFYLIPCFFML